MANRGPLSPPKTTCISAVELETVPTTDAKSNLPVAQLKPTATAAKIIPLNGRWRVRLDDRLQWILQRQQGLNSDGSPRCRDRSFCTQRRTLLRDIGDYCGDVDPISLRQVEALPERFLYRTAIGPHVDVRRAI